MTTMRKTSAAGRLAMALFSLLLLVPVARAVQTNYYYVSSSGSAAAPFDTWGKASPDIQAAVNQAQADLVPGAVECVVLVTNGTYTVTSQIAVSQAISLAGFSGNPEDTIIRGGYPASTNRCLVVSRGTVDSLTVSNGYVDPTCLLTNWGGGVYMMSNAVLRNCRIVGNQAIKGTPAGVSRGAGVYMTGGLITGCWIASNAVREGAGVGVFMDYGGTVVNSTITSNREAGLSVNGCNGGGLFLDHGGVVSNCVVYRNAMLRNGGGICQSYGGRVTQCVIAENSALSGGGGLYLDRGPCVVERCEILRNTASGGTGGGVYISYNDVMQDCLIAGNAAVNGAGISVMNTSVRSLLRNCTIVRNSATATCGGLQLGVANAIDVYNTVIYDNTASATNNIGGVSVNNTNRFGCYGDANAAFLGVGCITNNPRFADSGSGSGTNAVLGDYTLQTNSPCIGAGTNGIVASAFDLAGNGRIRPAWGVVDMGAYEAIELRGALTNGVTASPAAGAAPLQVLLAGETAGSTNGLLFKWNFGDGATQDWSPSGVVTHVYAAARTNAYRPLLSVSNAAGETASASCTVVVYPLAAYVATNGGHVSPFDTWAKAATNIQAAVDVAGAGFTTVLISNGVYRVAAEVTVARDILVRGVSGNWDDVVVQGGYPASSNRCFNVSSAGAVVDGLTITNGNLGALSQGGGGVYLSAGTIRNCLIIGNTARGASANAGAGAGVYCTAGSILNCAVKNNTATYSDGGGIYTLGLVSNCLVAGNTTVLKGGGIRLVGSGLSIIDRCVVVSNTATGSGGGIYKSNSGLAFVRNTLAACNLSRAVGGGMYLDNGSVLLDQCTLAGNLATNGGGVYSTIAAVGATNCIVANNLASLVGGTNDIAGVPMAFGYSCSPDLVDGVSGNRTADPLFVNAGSGYGPAGMPGDYHVLVGSPALDGGTAEIGTAIDLDGAARPVDGDGNGSAAFDMGAYESASATTGVLRCSFAMPANRAVDSLDAVLTGFAAGSSTNNLFYFWSFGDGTTSDWSSATREVSHTYGLGSFTVSLSVSNDLGQVADYARTAFVTVYPSYVYVSTNGGHIAPFGSWAAAATNLQAAVDTAAAGPGYTLAVLVSNGTYTVASEVVIASPVTVRGFSGNREDTVIRGAYPASTNRVFTLSSAGAVLDGLTVTNGRMTSATHGGGIYMTAGTVQNCLVIGNICPNYQGGGIYMQGGLVQNSSILNNTASIAGGGIAMQGTFQGVRNCLISGNLCLGQGGGGVSIEGGYLAGCVISNNLARTAGGVYQRAGSCAISNCVIVGNASLGTGGGVAFLPASGAGIFRNCLVAGNTAVSNGGGVAVSAPFARFENCTVAGNSAGIGGGWYQAAPGTGVNCIVYFNQATNASAALADVGSTATNVLGALVTNLSYSCSPALATGGGSGNVVSDPRFANPGSGFGTNHVFGQYRLKAGSPCADSGQVLSWMAGTLDVEGSPRILGAGPNMGAFEKTKPDQGALLLIR